MVSALDSGASGMVLSPGRRHCVVFLGKTPISHSPSLHPGIKMSTGKMLGKPNKLRGSDLRWTSIPSSSNTSSRFMLQRPRSAPAAMSQSQLQGFTFSPKPVLKQLIKIDIIIENPFPTSTKILYLGVSTLFSYGLICIDQGFLGGFRKLTSITFSVEIHFVIF